MARQGEVSWQEIMALVETAREYLGPMWVKKNMKAAANIPVKGIINRKQLASVHPLGLLFREVEKSETALAKGKPLANAANILLIAGLGRNLKSLDGSPGFELLMERLKQPAGFTEAALLAEIGAHWQKLGYSSRIIVDSAQQLCSETTNGEHTYFLYPRAYTFIPGSETSGDETLDIPGNFIYSQWWDAWAADAQGRTCTINLEVAEILNASGKDSRPGTILYLDLPPYTTKETFWSVLGTAANHLTSESKLVAVIICLAEYLPHLYVRHTLPVYACQGENLLPKSLLNTLSY